MNILQYYFPCLRNNNYWNTSTKPNNKLLQYIVFEYIRIYSYPNIFSPTTTGYKILRELGLSFIIQSKSLTDGKKHGLKNNAARNKASDAP